MDLGLKDAKVFIQGGTRGMGRAAAECFAADGACIALFARTQADLDETAGHLRALGSPEVITLNGDIGDDQAVVAAFAEVKARWGELNVLVNAAGPVIGGNIEDLNDAQWLASFDIGTLGMVRCCREAIPLLKAAKWGRIVNVSAHSTKRQTAGLIAYTAAKAATTSISKNLSLTLAPAEILVNTVSPGSFASPGLKRWVASVGGDQDDPYAIMKLIDEHFGHPAHLPRAGLPSEIGPVIAFLGSQRNSYMTGANVNVDGGSDFT